MFFFKQKTAYEMRISDWSSDVCSSDLFWELSPRLPDGAILTSDSGSCAIWYARDLKIRRGMMASLSGGLASMGAAVPYAIAAKLAHPEIGRASCRARVCQYV